LVTVYQDPGVDGRASPSGRQQRVRYILLIKSKAHQVHELSCTPDGSQLKGMRFSGVEDAQWVLRHCLSHLRLGLELANPLKGLLETPLGVTQVVQHWLQVTA